MCEDVSVAEWTEEVGTAAVPEGVSEAEWTEEVGKAAVSAQCLKGSWAWNWLKGLGGKGAWKAGVIEEVGKTKVVACGKSEGNGVQHVWVMQTHEPTS